MMRLSVPICYNFLQLARVNEAALFVVMGPIKYVKFLGEDFNKWVVPIALLLMAFMTLFNIYGKILNCIGLKQLQFGTEHTQDKIEEGKYIIE